MDNLIKLYTDFINEAASSKETFEEFATTRLAGATKIAETAKEKGGDAMLTYHHFNVKLPYYKKASQGKLDIRDAKLKLTQEVTKLTDGVYGEIKLGQIEFQKLVGVIEVLGELVIRSKSK
jgi:hypothetical protein